MINTIFLFTCLLTAEPTYQDGSIILFQDSFMTHVIENKTGSDLTHAAIIFQNQGKLWVYESAPPAVVRIPFDEYKKRFKTSKYYIYSRNQPFKKEQTEKMLKYADSQLGRKYMLRQWLLERETKGIHCSQYAGNILQASGLYQSKNYKESPVAILNKIKSTYELVESWQKPN